LALAAAILTATVENAADEPAEEGVAPKADPVDESGESAASRSVDDVTARPQVEVHLVGVLGRDRALAQLLDEWLGASQIDHVIVRSARLELDDIKAPRASGPPVRMWIVAVHDRLARLYFAEPDAARFLVRDVPASASPRAARRPLSGPPGLDELERERLVQVALSSVLAFIEQRTSSSLDEIERSMTPLAAPVQKEQRNAAPLPPGDPGTERTRGTALAIGLLYGASNKGGEGVAHGPGASAELLTGLDPFALSGFLQAQYRLPREATTEHVRLAIQEIVADAGLAVELRLSPSWFWRGEVGGGVQFVHLDPTARSADVRPLGGGWQARGIVFGAFGPGLEIDSARFALRARLDVEPVGTRYELADQGVRQTELVVPRLQPGLMLTADLRRSIFGAHAARSAVRRNADSTSR
jgi:hypothetical protein